MIVRHFTASGIILDEADRVLLVKHTESDVWLYPGGHIEPNEDPAEAVRREIREEVGIEVDIFAEQHFSHPAVVVVPSPFTILVMDVADAQIGPHQHIDMVYLCRPCSGNIVRQPEEIDVCAWVPLTDVAALETPPELPALIATAAKFVQSRVWDGKSPEPRDTT